MLRRGCGVFSILQLSTLTRSLPAEGALGTAYLNPLSVSDCALLSIKAYKRRVIPVNNSDSDRNDLV